MALGECAERWNVDRPADVMAIHHAYRNAGCDLVQTNTFGGTALSLKCHGLESRADELNREGARFAREAVGDGVFVLAPSGRLADFLHPLGMPVKPTFFLPSHSRRVP